MQVSPNTIERICRMLAPVPSKNVIRRIATPIFKLSPRLVWLWNRRMTFLLGTGPGTVGDCSLQRRKVEWLQVQLFRWPGEQ